jgi:hypothetical protein
MGDMGGGGGAPPPPADGGGEAPLSESYDRKATKTKKSKILGMLGEEKTDFSDLFDMNKAQQNIYEIETKLREIINE